MNDFFIENILLNHVMGIEKLEIPLSKETRKHLIITGKNGSGKTTTLKAINVLLNKLIANGFSTLTKNKQRLKSITTAIETDKDSITNFEKQKVELTKQKDLLDVKDSEKLVQINNHINSYQSNIISLEQNIKQRQVQCDALKKQIDDFSTINLTFSHQHEVYQHIVNRQFILAFFEAKRENQPIVSNAIQNIVLDKNYTTDTKSLHKRFIEYMVKLRNQMLNDKFDGKSKETEKIQTWFTNFENTLKDLFNEPSLRLKYYNEELNFKIEFNQKSFGLNELSDGYSSLLSILTELILRMEAHDIKAYDMQGVVLIDEIETHLHVDLQKKILPFLVNFFPKIQFIITTHSPFVLSSLSNTVICDLEKQVVLQDLSSYSYDALIESYFDSDKYSKEVKDKINKFETLSNIKQLNAEEEIEYIEFENYFKRLPTYMADELDIKIKQLLQKRIVKGNC